MLRRLTTFLYGLLCYLLFFGTFLYAIGFIGNILVPKSIDSGKNRVTWGGSVHRCRLATAVCSPA